MNLQIRELIQIALSIGRMTKKALAEELGVDKGTLNKWLNGSSEPSASQLIKLLRMTGLAVSLLNGPASQKQSTHKRLSQITAAETFIAKDAVVVEMFNAGEVLQPGALAVADALVLAAQTEDQKALAYNRRSGFLEQAGRYVEALNDIAAADLCRGTSIAVRMQSEVNRASYLLDLDRPVDSYGVARAVTEHFEEFPAPTTDRLQRSTEAFAWYVSGSALNRKIAWDPSRGTVLGAKAATSLILAEKCYEALCVDFPEMSRYYSSILTTTRYAYRLATVECEDASQRHAAVKSLLDELMRLLDSFIQLEAMGQDLDTAGRVAVMAAELVSRHYPREDQGRPLGVLLGKARDIAEATTNWRLYERVYAYEWDRRLTVRDILGEAQVDWPALDDDDVMIIAGLMSRFPQFQETGVNIFRASGFTEKE